MRGEIDMKEIKDSFISYASEILGDTEKGLTGSQIIKKCNSYSIDFDVEIPITSSDFGKFGSLVPNKRTALYRNLQKFNSEQCYKIISELCELEIFKENAEVQKLKSKVYILYGSVTTERDNNPVVNTDTHKVGIDKIDEKPTVFISYNRNNSSFADEIESSISALAQVKRDTNDIENWASIIDFMKTIRGQDFAVLIISPEYLKSTSCLFEVIQLMKEDKWIEKTMFVVIDGFNIYNLTERTFYIQYWNKSVMKLERI